MINLKFTKENDYRWFAEVPGWEGDRDELEMVMGADTMLDYISQEEDSVYLTLSLEEFKGYEYLLTLNEEVYDGGNYHLVGKNVEFDVWICHVTKFVFGHLPEKIYIK